MYALRLLHWVGLCCRFSVSHSDFVLTVIERNTGINTGY